MVDPHFPQFAGHPQPVLQGKPLRRVLGERVREAEADGEDPFVAQRRPDCLHHLEEETRPVFDGSPVAVPPEVREWAEELTQEIPVAGVDLHAPVTGLQGPPGGGRKSLHRGVDFPGVHRPGLYR